MPRGDCLRVTWSAAKVRARALAGIGLLAVLLGGVFTALAEARPWAWLGVRIRDLSEQEMESVSARHGVREGFGAVIVEVLEDTPAARAGLRNGDIVVAFNDRPITETRLLQRLIAGAGVDQDVRLIVLRPEGRRPLAVRLSTMPRSIAGERMAVEFGFALRDADPPTAAREARPISDTPAVGAVIPRSAAARAGLQVGDTILQINDHGVLTREAAREVLADLDPDKPLRLVVRRAEERLPLTLSIGERG